MHHSSAVRYIYTHTLIRTLVRIVADSIHKSHFKDAINGVVMNSEGDKQQHQHLKEISVFKKSFAIFLEMIHALVCANRDLLLLNVEESETEKKRRKQLMRQELLHEREIFVDDSNSSYNTDSGTAATSSLKENYFESLQRKLGSAVGIQAELQRALSPICKSFIHLNNHDNHDNQLKVDHTDDFVKLCSNPQGNYFSGNAYKKYRKADRFGVFPKAW